MLLTIQLRASEPNVTTDAVEFVLGQGTRTKPLGSIDRSAIVAVFDETGRSYLNGPMPKAAGNGAKTKTPAVRKPPARTVATPKAATPRRATAGARSR